MQKRIFWLDVARAVAIILVVFAHCHEILNFVLFTQTPIPSVDVWKASLCYSFSRVGVPLFFMISGALILKKQLANTSNCHIKRILMFVILGVVYSIICNAIWDYYNTGKLINALWGAIKKYNFILTNDLGIVGQLWFFRGIIPLYLAAPFIALWLKEEDNVSNMKKYILITLIVILLPSVFHRHFLLNSLYPSVFATFPLYFSLGFLINENKILQHIAHKYIFWSVLFICSTILSISIDSHKGALIPELHYYLTSPFVFINSVAVIIIIKNIFTRLIVK